MGMFVNDDSGLGEDYIKDDAGGVHEEGLGWNPQGVFCGECSNRDCSGCKFEHEKT